MLCSTSNAATTRAPSGSSHNTSINRTASAPGIPATEAGRLSTQPSLSLPPAYSRLRSLAATHTANPSASPRSRSQPCNSVWVRSLSRASVCALASSRTRARSASQACTADGSSAGGGAYRPEPMSNSSPASAPRSLESRARCSWLKRTIPERMARYSSQRPNLTLAPISALYPLTIAVLKGGMWVGWRKYIRLATAGPRPLMFRASSRCTAAISSASVWQQAQVSRKRPKASWFSRFS